MIGVFDNVFGEYQLIGEVCGVAEAERLAKRYCEEKQGDCCIVFADKIGYGSYVRREI